MFLDFETITPTNKIMDSHALNCPQIRCGSRRSGNTSQPTWARRSTALQPGNRRAVSSFGSCVNSDGSPFPADSLRWASGTFGLRWKGIVARKSLHPARIARSGGAGLIRQFVQQTLIADYAKTIATFQDRGGDRPLHHAKGGREDGATPQLKNAPGPPEGNARMDKLRLLRSSDMKTLIQDIAIRKDEDRYSRSNQRIEKSSA